MTANIYESFEFIPFKATTHPKGVDNGLARVMLHDYGFCLITPDGRQVSQFSTCRAYIGDIYTFYYQGAKEFIDVCWYKEYAEPDTNNIRIGLGLKKDLIESDGTRLDTEIHLIIDFLNKIETGFGFELTKVYRAVNEKKSVVYMLVGDKKWLTSAVLISLYSLLIRSCTQYHTLDQTWEETLKKRISNPLNDYDRDNQSLKKAFPYIKKFVKFNPMTFFKTDPEFNFHKNICPYRDSHDFGIEYFANNTATSFITNEAIKAIMDYAHRFKSDEAIQEFLNKEQGSVVKIIEEAEAPAVPAPIGVAVKPKRKYTKKIYKPEGVLA